MRPNGDPCAARIVEHDLHAFVDGVLDDNRRNDLLAYLAAHPLEAEKVKALFRQRATLEALGAALATPDDAEFAADLQRRIGTALLRQRVLRAATRIAAALAVALPLAAGALWLSERLPLGTAKPDEPLGVAYSGPVFPFGSSLDYVDDGMVDDGAETLAHLAGQLQSHSIGLPDLADLGLRLVGGEAVPGVDHPAARLIYTNAEADRLLVYVGLASESTPQAFMLVPEGHMSLHWRKGPLVFAVVGPVEMPVLLEVMRSVSTGVTAVAQAPVVPPPAPAVVAPEVAPALPTTPVLRPADPATPAAPPLGKEEAKVL